MDWTLLPWSGICNTLGPNVLHRQNMLRLLQVFQEILGRTIIDMGPYCSNQADLLPQTGVFDPNFRMNRGLDFSADIVDLQGWFRDQVLVYRRNHQTM